MKSPISGLPSTNSDPLNPLSSKSRERHLYLTPHLWLIFTLESKLLTALSSELKPLKLK